MIGRPIDRLIDIVNHVLVILCYIILNIDYDQGFLLHGVSS